MCVPERKWRGSSKARGKNKSWVMSVCLGTRGVLLKLEIHLK